MRWPTFKNERIPFWNLKIEIGHITMTTTNGHHSPDIIDGWDFDWTSSVSTYFRFFLLMQFGCCDLMSFVHLWRLTSVTCEHMTEWVNNCCWTVKPEPQHGPAGSKYLDVWRQWALSTAEPTSVNFFSLKELCSLSAAPKEKSENKNKCQYQLC